MRARLPIILPEAQPLTIGRNNGSNAKAFGDFCWCSTFDRHLPQCTGYSRLEVFVHYPFTVRRKLGPVAFGVTGGQLNRIATIAVHAPNLKNAGAIGMENDKTIIGRYGGRIEKLSGKCVCDWQR